MKSRLSFSSPLVLVAGLAMLAGCAVPQTQQAGSTARLYANDLAGGAKVCNVPRAVTLVPGQPTDATMVVDNDGGWCGILVAQPGPKPFNAGLVADRPEHGRLHIRKVGDNTRVDYIPNAAYAGSDAFAVRLLPGGSVLRVAVTVSYTAPPAPPPPPAAPPRAPAARRR